MVKKSKEIELDFIVDRLTNSIENVVTRDSFATEITIWSKVELKIVSKKNGWLFNWTEEFKNPIREVYKLTIVGNPNIIQGLICIEVRSDHVYMHLVKMHHLTKGN